MGLTFTLTLIQWVSKNTNTSFTRATAPEEIRGLFIGHYHISSGQLGTSVEAGRLKKDNKESDGGVMSLVMLIYMV